MDIDFCFREIEPDFDPGAAIMVNSTSNMPDHLQAIDKEFNEIILPNDKESIRQYLRYTRAKVLCTTKK